MFPAEFLPSLSQIVETGLAAVSLIISIGWAVILLSPVLILMGAILVLAVSFLNHSNAPPVVRKLTSKRKSPGYIEQYALAMHTVYLFVVIKCLVFKVWLKRHHV